MTKPPPKEDESGGSPMPPYRQPRSEVNLQIPVDAQWFHEFRQDVKYSLKELKLDVSQVKDSVQDHRLDIVKHSEQIEAIAKDMFQTDKHLEFVDNRVVALEKKAGDESAVNRAVRSGWGVKIMDGAAGQLGTALIIGAAALFLWLLQNYFRATPR